MPRACKKNRCQNNYYTQYDNYSQYDSYNQYDVPSYTENDAYRQVFTRQFENPFDTVMNNMSMNMNDSNMNMNMNNSNMNNMNMNERIMFRDHGPEPYVVDIAEATKMNDTFRTALWTGEHLQLTLMSINVGEDIGLEIHPDVDQFLRIEEGQGITMMGENKNNLNFQRKVKDDYAVFIPAGTWHNLVNTGNIPLKLYSIYAPPNHPHGTVHVTKADAEAAETFS